MTVFLILNILGMFEFEVLNVYSTAKNLKLSSSQNLTLKFYKFKLHKIYITLIDFNTFQN